MASLIHTTATLFDAPRKTFHVDSKANYMAEVSRLLSSPIAAYEVEHPDSRTVIVQHRLTYKERYKASKQNLSDVVDDLCQSIREEREENKERLKENEQRFQGLEKTLHSQVRSLEEYRNSLEGAEYRNRTRSLEDERDARREALLEWETKSRLAQGVNDYYVFFDEATPKSIPKDAYMLLKAEGCGYLPYLFTVWAVFNERQPATRFDISREEEEAFIGRANGLVQKGLDNSVELVWNSIPLFDRSFMVSMFLSRPAIRNLLVHVTPTIRQAKHVIDSDPLLDSSERGLAEQYLPIVVDKHNNALFNIQWYVAGTLHWDLA